MLCILAEVLINEYCIVLYCTVHTDAGLGMFSMFGRTGAHKKGPTSQKVSDSSATFSGIWGHLCGVLRHLKVHLVQHAILWPL